MRWDACQIFICTIRLHIRSRRKDPRSLVASMQSDNEQLPEFNIRVTPRYRRPTRRRLRGLWLLLSVSAVCGAVVSVAIWSPNSRESEIVRLLPIEDQDIRELETLKVAVAVDPRCSRRIRFTLASAPRGAKIDPTTGVFTWTPSEEHGPGQFEITVQAHRDDSSSVGDRRTFRARVAEVNRPPRLPAVRDRSISSSQLLAFIVTASDPDSPAAPLRYSLGPGAPSGASIDSKRGFFRWRPTNEHSGQVFSIELKVEEVAKNGLSSNVSFAVHVESPTDIAGTARFDTALPKENVAPAKMTAPEPSRTAPVTISAHESLISKYLKLYNEFDTKMKVRKLFSRRHYGAIRKAASQKFEQDFNDQINEAFGEDYEAISQWLGEHVDIKEEFFTAIDPNHDNVLESLSIFYKLWRRSPERLQAYPSLAIAIAITWDDRNGVYRYNNLSDHAKSPLPEDLVSFDDNYDYLIRMEDFMEGRIRFVPWEFLALVVNHQTPVREREWAMQEYVPKRVMFGRCYHDVPYDFMMLRSGREQARLNGELYTLPNLRRFGGVCAYQADYASRVGKSIGVPAAYVAGDGRFGEAHAWVMWVELSTVTPNSIGFSLESHGRYRYDNYYVGRLNDPQTGKQITDRDLELRLHTVGVDMVAKRQANLIMRSYLDLREDQGLDFSDQLSFLADVIRLCPGNESAWFALSRLPREQSEPSRHQIEQFRVVLDELFRTFSDFPDFTWKVFDDLIAFEADLSRRIQYYERLGGLYLSANRPDLAFKVRLRLTDLLIEDERKVEAIQELAAMIRRFPNEGHYVPTMLDRLEELGAQADDFQEHLVQFYQEFLPTVSEKRGNDASKYCLQVYERGIRVFEQADRPDLAHTIRVQLERIKATTVN